MAPGSCTWLDIAIVLSLRKIEEVGNVLLTTIAKLNTVRKRLKKNVHVALSCKVETSHIKVIYMWFGLVQGQNKTLNLKFNI